MPSPIAHMSVGYQVYRVGRRQLSSKHKPTKTFLAVLLVSSIVFSMVPDIDALLGIIASDLGRYHNNRTHSLFVGAIFSLLGAGFIGLLFRKRFTKLLGWYLVFFSSYSSHVIMDFLTYGSRGVMLFWPLSSIRYDSTIKLFYGVRWSDGWLSVEHLWTIISELAFAIIIMLIIRWKENRFVMRTVAQ